MHRRLKIFITLFLVGSGLLLKIGFSAASDLPEIIILVRGQSRTMNLEYEAGDVAIADNKCCDFQVSTDRKNLYLSAKDRGETALTVWDSSGQKRDEFRIRVVVSTLKDILDAATERFGSLEGVRIEIKNGRVEIDGEVADPDEFREIESFASRDSSVKNSTRLSEKLIGRRARLIEESIGIHGVKARPMRDRILLEGVIYGEADRKKALEIASLYSDEIVDLLEVRDIGRRIGGGELVELEFHMMEVKKGALRELGLSWAPGAVPSGGSGNGSVGGDGMLSSIGDLGRSVLGFVFQFIPKLKSIRERGEGRVLENSSLVIKSGDAGEIFSGSEIPFYRDDEVGFKKVGIEIKAEPVVIGDSVDIKLKTTLSSPSPDIRGAVDTHTISTTALCPLGHSVVIGNIIRNVDVKMKNRVPRGIDTSSALFTLFLSRDFQSNRSEFVVFITPKKVRVPSPGAVKLAEFLSLEEKINSDAEGKRGVPEKPASVKKRSYKQRRGARGNRGEGEDCGGFRR